VTLVEFARSIDSFILVAIGIAMVVATIKRGNR
jgi:hypothetical protein